MNSIVYSQYAVPTTATGDDRIYGRFEGCTILGMSCDIEAKPLQCGDDACVDALGVAGVFRRGDMAIHVSGINDFGEKTGPGFIRAIASYCVHWRSATMQPPSGLGCDGGYEPTAIVTWDSEKHSDSHYHKDLWAHHAYYSACSSFFTMAGIVKLMDVGKVFTPTSILHESDIRLGKRSPMLLGEKPHTVAMRRLLEEAVGVTNTIHGVVLKRAGRWSYRFEWKGGE